MYLYSLNLEFEDCTKEERVQLGEKRSKAGCRNRTIDTCATLFFFFNFFVLFVKLRPCYNQAPSCRSRTSQIVKANFYVTPRTLATRPKLFWRTYAFEAIYFIFTRGTITARRRVTFIDIDFTDWSGKTWCA